MNRQTILSLVPFTLFVGAAIGLSFIGAVDINLLIAIGLLSMLAGALLTRQPDAYWNYIFEFFGSKTAMTATLLWLLVGVYGQILKEGHIVEGLVWAAHQFHISSATFTVVVFLFSGLFAIATGSGFGTISAMSLTLFPAGIALGGNAPLLGGAILSGAALGDSIAPVSDTAVIAASTQQYSNGQKVADIGGTVKNRLPFVLTALFISVVTFWTVGKLSTVFPELSTPQEKLSTPPSEGCQQGLALLIPTLIVIVLSFRKVNIFLSLASGIAAAICIGLGLELFTCNQLINIEGGHVGGAIVDGIGGMANICLLLMVVVSLSGLIIRSGCMERFVNSLSTHLIRSPRGAELTIFSLVSLAGILIAAVNTIANICIAPFVNDLGKQQGLHPYRRSTLLATVICTFPFVLPYGGCVLLLQRGIESTEGVNLQASDVFLTAFYPWALLVVMLVACLTGIGRKHETGLINNQEKEES